MRSTKRVCVVGAGVIGLSVAVKLQEDFPDSEVTLIADRFNNDTLSADAGGIFRPSPAIRGPTPDSAKKWLSHSYNFYKSLQTSEKAQAAGVMEVSGYQLTSGGIENLQNDILKELVPNFTILTAAQLHNVTKNYKWQHGAFYTTLIVDCKKYLPFLLKRFKLRGGIVRQQKIMSFQQLSHEFDVLVNCTGLGAKELTNDDSLIPMRGQTYKVKAPWIKMFYYGDLEGYILPGVDQVTLGGTRQFDNWNEKVDKYDSMAIMDRCCVAVPSVKNAEILKEWVGLRPYRPEVRLEIERIPIGEKTLQVVHNYGHGGYGVCLAWGCAGTASQLVKECFENIPILKSKL